MKRILTTLLFLTALIIASAPALAYDPNVRISNHGVNGYSVKLYNPYNYAVICEITANNGAYYRFRVYAHSWSSWKKINHPGATYIYACQ